MKDAFGVEHGEVNKGLKQAVQGVKAWRAAAPGRRFARQAAREARVDRLNATFNAERPGVARMAGQEAKVSDPNAKWYLKAKAKQEANAVGSGPGASRVSNKPIQRMPAKPHPYGGFVEYDAGLAAQRQRAAMKSSFGKRDSRQDPKPLHPLAVGAATAGGALAGQSAYMGVVPFNNHVMKPYFSRKMEALGPDSKEAQIWRDWNKPQEPRVRGKHSANPKVDPGFRQGEKPTTEEYQRPLRRNQMEKENQSNTKRAAWHGSKEFHRKFPRGLPGWRTHRALSYAGKGLSGHATGAALMGGGALAAYKVATHQPKAKVKKSFFQYVPKTQMTLKTIVRDPGFLVPVGGVTLAGAGGATLATRKYRKRKLK